MTRETTEQCLVICLDLLRFQRKPENKDSALFSPCVIHSILLLLTRPALNIPMISNITIDDSINGSPIIPGLLLGKPKQPSILKPGIFSTVKHIIEFSLSNTADLFDQNRSNIKRQCLSREVASSLPSAISFLRKLAPRSFHCDQQLSILMSKMSSKHLYDFLFRGCNMVESDGGSIVFSNILLNRSLNCIMGTLTYDLWSNPLLKKCPAHIVNPVVSLVADALSNLEPDTKSSKKRSSARFANSH